MFYITLYIVVCTYIVFVITPALYNCILISYWMVYYLHIMLKRRNDNRRIDTYKYSLCVTSYDILKAFFLVIYF